MNDKRLNQAFKDIGASLVPISADIWPRMVAALQDDGQRFLTQQHPTRSESRPSSRSWRVVVAAAIMLLILIAACAATPQGHAAVERMLEHFGFVLIQAKDLQPSVSQPAQLETAGPPLMPIAEIQKNAPFRIPLPSRLPQGVTLLGGQMYSAPAGFGNPPEANRTVVFLQFGSGPLIDAPQGKAMSLLVNTLPGSALRMLVPASASQQVTVSQSPAICVKGAWSAGGTGTSDQSLGALRWDTAVDQAALSWETKELAYSMWANGLGLECEDLVSIAESLR